MYFLARGISYYEKLWVGTLRGYFETRLKLRNFYKSADRKLSSGSESTELKKSKANEEMLVDAFADLKTWRRIVEKISEKNQSLAEKFVDFTKKLLDGVKKFFKAKEIQEKYPEVILTNKQFKNFVSKVEENICSVQNAKKFSVGYKILQSPYKYSPKKQKKFDIESARELIKKYSAESVKNLIQELSLLVQKTKNYCR